MGLAKAGANNLSLICDVSRKIDYSYITWTNENYFLKSVEGYRHANNLDSR